MTNHLKTWINSTKFLIVHRKNLVPTQNWISIDGLRNITSKESPNMRFNEYFLSGEPIKVEENNGLYYIIDGHHRYYRGLVNGYNYFLTENNNMYNPVGTKFITNFDVYKSRKMETKTYIPIDEYTTDDEEEYLTKLINCMKNIYNVNIILKRFVSINSKL